MSTDDFHTHALERAVVALLSNDARTLQDICVRINQPQFNLCLMATALSSSIDCLKIVSEPLKGSYNSSADCLNLLTLDNIDEERLKVLLPLSNPATVHPSTQNTLWSIGLLLKLPCSFYQNWNPDSQTIAESLPKMKDCGDLDLLRWCVKKVSDEHNKKNSITNYIYSAWEAAQNAKNFPFLNILAFNFNDPQRWVEEIQEKWEIWEKHCEMLTQYPLLAAFVVSVGIEKSNWRVVHMLIACAEKNPIVIEACLSTENVFACNWIFSQGFTLSAKNLWDQICCPEDRPLSSSTLAFFTHLLECNKKWSMGAWEDLTQECGINQLFCQLLMHSEEAANVIRSDLDPAFCHSLPLRLASALGREETVVRVLPYSDPQVYNSQALALAAINGHFHIMKHLLPHCDPTVDSYRALSCALWFDRQTNTNTCSSLLITSETSTEKMVKLWKQKITRPSHRLCSIDIFGSFEQSEDWNDIEDQMSCTTYRDIFSDSDDSGEVDRMTPPKIIDHATIYGMSWSNFDQPIENWWSSLNGSDLTRIGRHLLNVFPNALKKHLCDVNEKDNKPKKRKI